MLTAKDIMTKSVTTVGAATTIEELARILMEHKISGVPVVDDNENLIGIVTENDLISRDKRLHIPTVMRLFDSFIMLESPGKIEKEIKRMTAITVNDIYTKEAITVTEGTPVQDIATIMSEKRFILFLLLKEKKILGIIGKIDLIKGITGSTQ